MPGHPRVRSRFEQYADRACGVVFVVDAVDFLPHKTEVAEQLYEARVTAWWCVGTGCQAPGTLMYFQRFTRLIWHASCSTPALTRHMHQPVWRLHDGMQVLTCPAVYKRRLPLLLACNKADQGARAHTVDFLRRRLEREVAALALAPISPAPLHSTEPRWPCTCVAWDSNPKSVQALQTTRRLHVLTVPQTHFICLVYFSINSPSACDILLHVT